MVKIEPDNVSSPLNNAKQTSVELIKFDVNSKIHYQGYCKLGVKIYAKSLTVVPILENFRDIIGFTASFEWKFIRQKNIIFVFGEFEFENFALVFNDPKKCRKVYNGIFKNREKDYVHRKLLHTQFLNPFFKKITQNGSLRLKEIMDEWIEKHEGNEKEYYLKMLKSCKENRVNVYDVNGDIKQEIKSKITRKRKFREIQNIAVASEHNHMKNAELNPDNETRATLIRCSSKKKKPASNEHSKIIDESKFKIVYVKHQRSIRRKLLIFTSSERTHCYKYIFYPMKNFFYHRCPSRKNGIKAYLVQDENGNDCIKLGDNDHVCSPLQYDTKMYLEMKIIKKPNYEIMENCSTPPKRMLIIFDPEDRSQCYEYYWLSNYRKFCCCGCVSKRKHTVAEIWHENTDAEYITVLNDQHVCKIRTFDPSKYNQTNRFILTPNFEIQTKIKDGKEIKNLIIFAENDRKLCYLYHPSCSNNTYQCNGCRKQKYVSARICRNSDGEEYVILSNVEHVCSPKEYIPQLKEIILRPPKIKFIEATEKNTSKVIIFDSKENQLCYTFSKRSFKNSKIYYCLGCANGAISKAIHSVNEKKVVSAYLYKDKNGGEYYVKIMDGQKHRCKPQKYEPEIFQTKVLKPNDEYILFQTSVKKKDFLGLVIFNNPKDKKYCYEYVYSAGNKQFRCRGCQTMKVHIAAKIYQDSNGKEYILTNRKKHVCKPIKVSTIIKSDTVILEKSGLKLEEKPKKEDFDKGQIVRKPNFELLPNIRGEPDKKLFVFINRDEELCYEYGTRNYQFKCKKCNAAANLVKEDNEKYIILSKIEHTCTPIKYEKSKNIIKASDFMIFNKEDESKMTKLVVFTSSDKEKCYEYTFIQRFKYFQCCGCVTLNKKYVTAKLIKNTSEEECIQLSTNEHICIPKEFILEQFQPTIVSECGFILCSNKSGKPNSKLLIFDSNKDGFGYEYYLIRNNIFKCTPCKKKNKNVTAKLCEKENGEKYFELSVEKHICESKKFDPENYKEKNVIFDKFVVHHNRSGLPNSRLTMFDENDKYFGYQYYLNQNVNFFYCIECQKKGKATTLRLKPDEEGKQYVEFGKQEHNCSIIDFKEKNLIFESFKLEDNGKILITNDANRKKYELKYDEKLDAFCCIKCQEKKKHIITAAICKGDEGKEIVLLNFKHCCNTFSV